MWYSRWDQPAHYEKALFCGALHGAPGLAYFIVLKFSDFDNKFWLFHIPCYRWGIFWF